MVGTTRFELATSPTPRVRSTRLSHVPTIGLRVTKAGDGGVSYSLKCTRPDPFYARHARLLMARRNILLRQRTAFAEEKLVHLLHQKFLRLARPWLLVADSAERHHRVSPGAHIQRSRRHPLQELAGPAVDHRRHVQRQHSTARARKRARTRHLQFVQRPPQLGNAADAPQQQPAQSVGRARRRGRRLVAEVQDLLRQRKDRPVTADTIGSCCPFSSSYLL